MSNVHTYTELLVFFVNNLELEKNMFCSCFEILEVAIGEVLICEREPQNVISRYAVTDESTL